MKNLKTIEELNEGVLNEVGNSVRPVDVTYDGEHIILTHRTEEEAETNKYYVSGLGASVEGKNVLLDPERVGWSIVRDHLNK